MANPIVTIKHFDIEKELACKCCGLYAYDPNFLMCLEILRIGFNMPLIVTSGGRCRKHNEEARDKINSLHICEMQLASAVDVTCGDLPRLYNTAKTSLLFNEIIFYKEKKFIHLGIDSRQLGIYAATI